MTWLGLRLSALVFTVAGVSMALPPAALAQQQPPSQPTVPAPQAQPAPPPQPNQQPPIQSQQPPPFTAPAPPSPPSPAIQSTADTSVVPQAEAPSKFDTSLFSPVGPYRAPNVPQLPPGSSSRVDNLVRDGKLYLSLRDAIALAIENNLDVEVSRYNLLIADTDLTRAKGGGNLRGIDYTVQQPPPGVGGAASPLLITATTGNASPTNASVIDLSQVTQTGNTTAPDLSQNGTAGATYAPGHPFRFTIPRSPASSDISAARISFR